MIVKIWPIKAAESEPGKVGGIQGLVNAVEYIGNEEKCIPKKSDLDAAFIDENIGLGSAYVSKHGDFSGVVSYMSNEDKIKSKYASGYMCNPESVAKDFIWTQNQILNMYPDKTIEGNIAFHLVQSFPENLDISDEEVHQCGMELVRKIGKHQAYICSHVHPELKEDGELHGKSKHNHILINAYIHPDMIDPKRPEALKYYDRKDTYRQLQIWNDEIALEHGMPIIKNPDYEKVYSWTETEAINQGLSWKERVRKDIDLCKQKTQSWEQFKKEMELLGYTIKQKKHVTYITPDGEHKVRGNNLGERYTKESIENYWKLRSEIRSEMLFEDGNQSNYTLKDTVKKAVSPLYVSIPLGTKNSNEEQPSYRLSLDRKILNQDAIDSYFDNEKYYEIYNSENYVVDSVSGEDLHNYFTEIRRIENERFKQMDWWESEKERRRYQKIKEEELKEKNFYENEWFKNSKNQQTYKVSLYTKNGRLKTEFELIFSLALVVIHNEGGQWEPKKIPEDKVQESYFGPPAWKAQNIMDALQIAKEEGIENEFDMENRLNVTGSALSRARAAVRRNEEIKNKMETLNKAIADFEQVQYFAEHILNMEDGEEKYRLLRLNEVEIEQYKNSKHLLHIYKVETAADIADFKKRYAQVQKNIEESQELLDDKKEEYRRLKKLEYSKKLAQDVKYCYGYEYQPAQEMQQELKIDYDHTPPPVEPEQENYDIKNNTHK